MKKPNSLIEEFEQVYLTVFQEKFDLADTQNIFAEVGRGSGKTRRMMAKRHVQKAFAMPRSTNALAGPSYAFVIDSIAPAIISYLNQYYERGKFFEFGKEPPKHFKRPITPIKEWKHTISYVCGSVYKFAGIDRANTSLVGQDIASVDADELLRIKEENFRERLMPSKRGERGLFGKSHYFGGITGTSSTPNLETDHDWWMQYEAEMDEELVQKISYTAYRVSIALAEAEMWKKKSSKAKESENWDLLKKIDRDIEKKLRFAAKYEKILCEQRKGETTYMRGTSFTNLVILGIEYFKDQFVNSPGAIQKFELSLLSKRPNRVKDPFFARFTSKNVFEDSYTYTHLDLVSVTGEKMLSSRDLQYCNPNHVLFLGFDPGDFMSMVVGQKKNSKDFRFIKNFWCINPDQHFEMAVKFNDFFGDYQQRKILYLYYDRAGNQRKPKYQDNPKGRTDAKILKRELEDLGWTVHLMNIKQRTIYHWEHWMLWNTLLEERDKNIPKIKACQSQCTELISSIQMSPKKRNDKGFLELDKSAEKKLDPEDQVLWSPQIATAAMYLIFGLFEEWLPEGKEEYTYIPGL